MDESQTRVAAQAAFARIWPLAFGAASGVVALHFAPEYAVDSFFTAAAQIIPVLALGLAIDANVFGNPLGVAQQLKWLRVVDRVRVGLEVFVFGLFVAAELVCLYAIAHEGDARRDPWLVMTAIVTGFMTVGALSIFGRPRPRFNGSITVRPVVGPNDSGFVVDVGMGNLFGESDAEALLNVLIPTGIRVHGIVGGDPDGDGVDAGPPRAVASSTDQLEPGGPQVPVSYFSDWISLPVGQSAVKYFYLATTEDIPFVVKLSHSQAPGGGLRMSARTGTFPEQLDAQ